jgi:hypothetical protein
MSYKHRKFAYVHTYIVTPVLKAKWLCLLLGLGLPEQAMGWLPLRSQIGSRTLNYYYDYTVRKFLQDTEDKGDHSSPVGDPDTEEQSTVAGIYRIAGNFRGV